MNQSMPSTQTAKQLTAWKALFVVLLLLGLCWIVQFMLSLPKHHFLSFVTEPTYQGQTWRLAIGMVVALGVLESYMNTYRIRWRNYFILTRTHFIRAIIAIFLGLLLWELLYLLQPTILTIWTHFRSNNYGIASSAAEIISRYSASALLNEFAPSRLGQAGYIVIYLVCLPLFLEILVRGWYWQGLRKSTTILQILLTALLGSLLYWPAIAIILVAGFTHHFPISELLLTTTLIIYQLLLSGIKAYTQSLTPCIIIAIATNFLSVYLFVLPIGFAAYNGFTSPAWFVWM